MKSKSTTYQHLEPSQRQYLERIVIWWDKHRKSTSKNYNIKIDIIKNVLDRNEYSWDERNYINTLKPFFEANPNILNND